MTDKDEYVICDCRLQLYTECPKKWELRYVNNNCFFGGDKDDFILLWGSVDDMLSSWGYTTMSIKIITLIAI